MNILSDKLVTTALSVARDTLCLRHMLTPNLEALAYVAEWDHEASTLLMANGTSAAAQLGASCSSKLHTEGRCETWHHSCEAICNFRLFLFIMIKDVPHTLLLIKLLEYATLLVDRQGTTFFEAY
jgi:hypothetical protein